MLMCRTTAWGWGLLCMFVNHCAASRQKPFTLSQGLCTEGVNPSTVMAGVNPPLCGAHKGHILSWLLACSQHRFFCALQSFYRKGKVLLEMGRRAEALLAWEHCLMLNPCFQPAQREMEKVCGSAEWWIPCTPIAQGCSLM